MGNKLMRNITLGAACLLGVGVIAAGATNAFNNGNIVPAEASVGIRVWDYYKFDSNHIDYYSTGVASATAGSTSDGKWTWNTQESGVTYTEEDCYEYYSSTGQPKGPWKNLKFVIPAGKTAKLVYHNTDQIDFSRFGAYLFCSNTLRMGLTESTDTYSASKDVIGIKTVSQWDHTQQEDGTSFFDVSVHPSGVCCETATLSFKNNGSSSVNLFILKMFVNYVEYKADFELDGGAFPNGLNKNTVIYAKKHLYRESSVSDEYLMTTAANPISIPLKENCTFKGFYTESTFENMFIDENGYLTSTAVSSFGDSFTLYAKWISGPQPATIENIDDVDLTYGYSSPNLFADASVAEEGTTLTYQWYSNTTKSNTDGSLIEGATSATYSVPTGKDAGSYYYYCVVTSHNSSYGEQTTDKASNAVEVAVGKATPVLTAPTAKTSLGYNGSAQVLVNAGSTTGGTVLYKVDAGEYSSELPKATEIGTYVVSYKVDGGTNYTDIAEDSLEVTIGKGSINPVVTISDWTFSETASTPSTSGNPGSGEVTYQYKVKGADDSTYSIVVPLDAGEYTVKATVSETTNYLGGTATADFKIAQATPTGYDIPTGKTATYGDDLSSVALPDNWSWKTPTEKVGNAGNRAHTAIYTPTDPNYKTVEEDIIIEVAKANPTYTLPKEAIEAPYDYKLSQVALPQGFSWMDGNQTVNKWGENAYKAKYTPVDTANYNVVENIDIKVIAKWVLVDPTQGDVSVTINGDNEAFTVDISVKVEVKTEVTVDEKRNEYASLATKDFVKPNEDISAIYGVKLIRTINGVEEEIQPSDIKPGTKITVSMAIPEELVGKDFRLLHIHNSDDIVEVTNYAISKDGKTLMLEVDRLSDFAFITATDADNGFIYSIGLPGWALALIIIGGILLLAILALLILFFICNKWIIVDNKSVRVFVYNKKNKEENKLLTLTLKKYIRKEEEVYKNRQDALNALNK